MKLKHASVGTNTISCTASPHWLENDGKTTITGGSSTGRGGESRRAYFQTLVIVSCSPVDGEYLACGLSRVGRQVPPILGALDTALLVQALLLSGCSCTVQDSQAAPRSLPLPAASPSGKGQKF